MPLPFHIFPLAQWEAYPACWHSAPFLPHSHAHMLAQPTPQVFLHASGTRVFLGEGKGMRDKGALILQDAFLVSPGYF